MTILPDPTPNVRAGIPANSYTPEYVVKDDDDHEPAMSPEEREQYERAMASVQVLCPVGQDPFRPAEPPLELDDVVGIDHEESGKQFPDDPPAPDLGGVIMPTGMYKGQRLADIPRNYLECCISRNWCKPTPLGLTIVAFLGAGKGGAA